MWQNWGFTAMSTFFADHSFIISLDPITYKFLPDHDLGCQEEDDLAQCIKSKVQKDLENVTCIPPVLKSFEPTTKVEKTPL